MRRRAYLGAAGLGLGSVAGLTALGSTSSAGIELGPGTRGEGDPIETDETVTDDSITSLEGGNRVRYVTAYSGGEPARYRTEPFEKWARRRCAAVGAELVLPTVRERFGHSVEGVGRGVESRWFGTVISVDHTTELGEDGAPERTPNVTFEELVAVAPRSVRATVVLDGVEFTRDVPVVIQRVEMQGDPTLSS